MENKWLFYRWMILVYCVGFLFLVWSYFEWVILVYCAAVLFAAWSY